LSVEALRARNIPIHGIVYVGDENTHTESIISKITGLTVIGRIPLVNDVNSSFIQEQAAIFKSYFENERVD
jgi:dethiobiotin synthetase